MAQLTFFLLATILSTVASLQVTLYGDRNFKGDSFQKSIYTCQNIPKAFNDKAKSVKVTPDAGTKEKACVVLYENSCCQGRKIEVNKQEVELKSLEGQASSLSPCGTYAKAPAPTTATLVEHWSNHENMTVALLGENESVAVYADDQVKTDGLTWPVELLTKVWTYVISNYGAFGSGTAGKLNTVLHVGPEGSVSGQPFSYLHCVAEFRSMVHVLSGPGETWAQDPDNELLPKSRAEIDMILHVLAMIVEASNNGVLQSPAYEIWGMEHWAPIFMYDVFTGIDMKDEASRILQKYKNNNLLKNWFLPLYEQYEGGKVLSKFFQLLAKYFPQRPYIAGPEYTRRMNTGEFIHFWSGAAGVNLKEQAKRALGWRKRTAAEFEKARTDFSKITYKDE